jgi:DEAD/DEAH box helicase domain-containing protein
MFPTVLSSDIERALLDYLETTFHLSDAALEAALLSFLRDPQTGIFRGPYLDVRLPFRRASEDWERTSPLDYGPSFVPYAHQLRAFERLAARDREPSNTLVTTGTGSGKTECFLFPILDHCRRARQRGELGIKAIILYPMNALASDQAGRLAKLLTQPALQGVSAGLYVGGTGTHGSGGPTHLVDDRDVLRKSPPDILLTNYRMLDFLLMRPEDAPLWERNEPNTLKYLVLDELHTYDGAQGSDVACLIRRLKARLDIPESTLCCVGTSATLAGGSAGEAEELLAEFATKIFAEPFTRDCLIGEDRLPPEQAFSSFDVRARYPYAEGEEPWARLTPFGFESHDCFVQTQIPLWFEGKPVGPALLAENLGAHPFMTKLLRALAGRERRSGARHVAEVMAAIAAEDDAFGELAAEQQWLVLSSFVSLIAHARSPDADGKLGPFLHVKLELWVREMHGLLRLVSAGPPRFAWQDDLKAAPFEHWLPLVYCRECGFHAFAATQRDADDKLHSAPSEIGEAFLRGDRAGRTIELVSADASPASDADGQMQLLCQYLCERCLTLSLEPTCSCVGTPKRNLVVRVHPETDAEGRRTPLHRCPSCQTDDALTFLASRAATLSSVAVSQIFSSRFNADKKLLAFTDSVQDASHRAGFFASRAFRFSVRGAIQSLVEQAKEPISLESFGPRLVAHLTERLGEARAVAELMPPDLVEDPSYIAYFGLDKTEAQQKTHRPSPNARRAVLELLGTRTSWEVTREYGLAVGYGRSLEQTVCSTLSFDGDRLDAASAELAEHLLAHHRGSLRRPPDRGDVRRFLFGLLTRLRLKGGILHPLLEPFVRHDSRYFLSKRKEPRLSRFGPRSQVPAFWVRGEVSPSSTYQPLHASPKARTWYRLWTSRVLSLVNEQDPSQNQMLDRAVRALLDHGLVLEREGPAGRAVYGISPSNALVTRAAVRLYCSLCGHRLTLPEGEAERFLERPCMSFGCARGRYAVGASSEERESYYQALYRSGRIVRIFAAEHTGLLERQEREAVERAFKTGSRPDAPNLLTCTPTLEMGIDIGDLSAVMLCAVPPLPANYVQRVGRAGRSTGNAAVLTLANRRPHDRYFFEEPYEMLRGEIAPPGCFLDAPEMLARQLTAHAMDSWAKEREKSRGGVIPRYVKHVRLSADDPFPGRFFAYYREHKERLLRSFLALFGAEVSEKTAARLTLMTQGEGLAGPMMQALAAVKDQLRQYAEQGKTISARIAELEEDPSKASLVLDEASGKPLADAESELRELRDARSAYGRLRAELENKYPLNVLTDAGVIPNYAFPEPGVTLSALLRDPFDEQAEQLKPGKRVEYLRAASQAIREFAPFNTFYAEGHKIRVSQLDLGNAAAAIETYRLCRECHHMVHEPAAHDVAARCPRCDDPNWSDIGQRRSLVRFRRALSMMNRLEASTADDAEERERESYRLAELIDVGKENWSGARLVRRPDLVFGVELLQHQLLREINFGRRLDTAKASTLAGYDIAQRGFLVCRLCGKVSESEERGTHTPLCPVRRRQEKAVFERVYLYREFRSEAIRLLLPVSELEDAALLHSLKAALFLGFRKKFRGHPDHLAVTLMSEPRRGELRRFLVVYDTVPGGTGYLADLWKQDGILDVLELARDAMQTCRCAREADKDGCYRCLYAYQQSHEIPHISRTRAVEAIEAFLAARSELEDVNTLSEAPVDDLTESELERKFLRLLEERANMPGHSFLPMQHGGKSCHVLTTPNSRWLIEPQVNLGIESGVFRPCCPDFVLRCLSEPSELPIAVFCDGLRYHVRPGEETSRLGDDIGKRRALLQSGQFRVWSITWKDLEQGTGVTTLLTRVQRERYFQFFSKEPGAQWLRDDALRSVSSFGLLWEYLEHPDASVWAATAKRFVASMLEVSPPWSTESVRAEEQALRSSLVRSARVLVAAKREDGPPKRWAGLDARESAVLFFQIPASALQKGSFGDGELTLRLYDDPESRAAAGFEESWRAFLHAFNVLQFYPRCPEVVSTEFLKEDHEAATAESGAPPRHPSQPPSLAPSACADAYARFGCAFADGAHLPELAELLRQKNLPLPVEVTQLDLPPELDGLLIWPAQKLVLVQAPSAGDRERWGAAGFTVADFDAPAEAILAALHSPAS